MTSSPQRYAIRIVYVFVFIFFALPMAIFLLTEGPRLLNTFSLALLFGILKSYFIFMPVTLLSVVIGLIISAQLFRMNSIFMLIATCFIAVNAFMPTPVLIYMIQHFFILFTGSPTSELFSTLSRQLIALWQTIPIATLLGIFFWQFSSQQSMQALKQYASDALSFFIRQLLPTYGRVFALMWMCCLFYAHHRPLLHYLTGGLHYPSHHPVDHLTFQLISAPHDISAAVSLLFWADVIFVCLIGVLFEGIKKYAD